MTRKMMLIAGVAALAHTGPASAQKPERGGGADKQQQAERGGGGGGQQAERPQRTERPQIQRAERPQRIERQQQRVERQVQRQEQPQRQERQAQRQERPQRIDRQAQRPQRVERQAQRAERQVQRQAGQQQLERQQQRIDRRKIVREARRDDRQQQRIERSTDKTFVPARRVDAEARIARSDGRGYRPLAPVRASRDMIAMQPFTSKFRGSDYVSIGDRYDTNTDWSSVPAFYGSDYIDNGDYYYRYNDDYGTAYRIDRQSNLVSALIPLFGGYGIGDPWPQTYYSSYVPAGYRDYYYDTPDYHYRNDGYGIYQINAGTQLITALVSLVMGQGYGVGQTLPASYGAYNLPLDYRASYVEDDDSWYRYGNGFIYEVDPRSRLVEARYPLHSDAYFVGERWPVAYPDYNVPHAYRSEFYDTPDAHYRYADGGIYRVDPANQLILSLTALVSGDQFAVGQPMPSGYDIYNIPIDYRDRWADSGDEVYRYANGTVYRVDHDTRLIEEAFAIYS